MQNESKYTLYKLGRVDPDEQRFEYPNVWTIEKTTGPERLVLAPAQNQIDLMLRLIELMPEPFWVLYVLTVSRNDLIPGRYQAHEPKSRDEIRRFLKRFELFLENDGRHHLWIGSEPGPELLVYDRHNKVYAYGPLAKFGHAVGELGLTLSSNIEVSSPHSHHFHPVFDPDELALMNFWEWLHFPLQDSDDE